MNRQLPQRRKFHFVDNSRDGGLSADAKAHITSEGNRQKRLRQVQAFQQRQQSFSNSPDAAKLSPEEGGTYTINEPTIKSLPLSSTSNTSPSSGKAITFVRGPQRERARTPLPPSPLGLVERRLIDMDPFETMPARMDHSAKYLVGELRQNGMGSPIADSSQGLISPMFMETRYADPGSKTCRGSMEGSYH
jgi:hypothetical protein